MVDHLEWRCFCREKYYEYCDEQQSWGLGAKIVCMEQYFFENRWYLKRLYKKVYINS